jgi:uncharacterized protein (TIGR00661 family)
MRVLYGVNGEGMGHATRSHVVIDHLLERHDVRVVASGAALRHLSAVLPRVDEIFGPTFAMGDGQIRRWQTVVQNLRLARSGIPETVRHWIALVDHWKPDVVISDFEPLSGVYARWTRTPLVAVDNINMIDRCRHDKEIVGRERDDFLVARAVTKEMVPGAARYIVLTFFRPPVARRGTTLVPPIVRPEIARAKAEHGDHLVVYASGAKRQIEALRSTEARCIIYGMRGGPDKPVVDGNLEFRPPSNEGFVEALRTARGVVAGGGFSLMSEAVYLGKPLLAVPLRGQFEQLMNGRYLARLGYGMCAERTTKAALAEFMERLPEFEHALARYEQVGNSVALRTIEEQAKEAAEAAPRELRRAKRTARRHTPRRRSATEGTP